MAKRIVVAMSGGVDSSVAALLLHREGYDVVGLFMKNGISAATGARPGKQGCCSVEDAADARRVADTLGVPFYALDYREGFERLIDHFVDSYAAGRTPSPCVLCNTWLKFGELLAFAGEIGAEAVATGHYARRVEMPGGRLGLRKARDRAKDQTYFLASLSDGQLERARFPLGDLTKEEARALARDAGLRTADKAESMEICFVPGGDYRALLSERRPDALAGGDLVDAAGRAVGRHPGHGAFTIGQRRGLGVALGEPAYVTAIDPSSREVTVGPREALARGRLVGERMRWVSIAPPEGPVRCRAQIRHRSPAAPATATPLEGDEVLIAFDEPVYAVAPGQALALYDEADDLVLAGGFIGRVPSAT